MSINPSDAITTAVKDAAKVAALVLVVLGALPAICQALGVAHIVVPGSLLGYATIATTIASGIVSWAKQHGYVAKAASAIAHKVR